MEDSLPGLFKERKSRKSSASHPPLVIFHPRQINTEMLEQSSLSPCDFFTFCVPLWYESFMGKSYGDKTVSAHPFLCTDSSAKSQSYVTLVCS